jgi:benzoyl-CoA reductase/2-hydroxyglutaryl-CoA dehydratase subunit BcrC/BadD/HgdB
MKEDNYPAFAEEVSHDPVAQIESYKRQDRPVFGYTCSYVIEEFLDAMGIIPVRLIGRATNIQAADRHFQAYCCSQVRSLMEDFINDVYKNLDGVVFAHTCDSMQPFHDIFKRTFPKVFVKNLNLPSRLDGEVPFKYAVAETKRFLRTIEEFTGKPLDPSKLAESVSVYNRNRLLLEKLYSLHLKYPDRIPSRLLLQSVLMSQYIDKREANKELEPFIESFKDDVPEDKKRKRIMLIGNVNINEQIYDLADEFGAMIADDDMCSGHRYFSTQVAEPTIEGVVRRYMNRPHCAAKHRDNYSRQRYLLELAEKRGINGAIFFYLKFCDPHCFDYPDLKKALDGKNIPSQLIEVEQSLAPSGQLRTKMQAFAEMLSV